MILRHFHPVTECDECTGACNENQGRGQCPDPQSPEEARAQYSEVLPETCADDEPQFSPGVVFVYGLCAVALVGAAALAVAA